MTSLNKTNTFNFNKEILFGELGSILGSPLISYLASQFTSNIKIISFFAVIGAIIGASVFWLSMRVIDKKKQYEKSIANLGKDILYFTPAAFLLTLLIYYPTLYFLSYNFLNSQNKILLSVIFAQLLAFTFFLIMINIYRYFLAKYYGKIL